MLRCLDLAKSGAGYTSPNPMVGSVIVNEGRIIGEGYHKNYGEAHAEVNAINSVAEKTLLSKSTLYVNLEPCSHFGKTPPCTDLILDNKIPNVIIGTVDPNSIVSGKGIEKLKKNNVNVKIEVLKNKCIELNKQYFLFHKEKRPYVILKWAQSKDGFMDINRTKETGIKPYWISNEISKSLVHKWRSEVQGILIGTNTALNDNPKLNLRDWEGKNPIRIVMNRELSLTPNLFVMDNSVPTIIFNEKKEKKIEQTEFIKVKYDKDILKSVLLVLYKQGIMNIMVEGGKKILESFITENLWDEARIFEGDKIFHDGLAAPAINEEYTNVVKIHNDKLFYHTNNETTKKLFT